MSKTRKNLIFYERQFNTIKGLIAVANSCISESIEPDKIAKGYFYDHVSYWETIQSPVKKKLFGIELTQEEEYPLMERMVIMMNLLVSVKKTSQAAKVSQKSNKITLFELLVRLRDLVLKQNRAQIIPSFTLPEMVTSHRSSKKESKRSLFAKSKGEKELLELNVKGINLSKTPRFISEVLSKQLHHLHSLSQLGKANEQQGAIEIKKYAALQKRSLAAGKEFEGKAYEIICKMFLVNKKLNQAIRNQIDPEYEKLLVKVEDMVQYYKEKENNDEGRG